MASKSISGWSGSGDRTFTLTVTESSYDSVANTSVVSWSLSITGGSGQSMDTYVKCVVNGTTVYNASVPATSDGGYTWNGFPANTGSTSGTQTVSHAADGTKSISFSIEGYAVTYTTKSASGTLTLTSIDRTAPTVTASTPSSVTINSMSVTATSSVTASQFAIRYKTTGDYGAWTYWSGSTTSHAFSLTGLSNNTTYTIQVAAKKSSNGVWGYSSTVSAKTLGASTITSASNVTLGNACSVKWTPLNSTFKFKLTFSLGSWSYTTGYISPNSTSAYTYTGYTIPLTVADQLPNATSGTMTVVLTTYTSGNTQVGSTSSKTFTVTVPSSVKPSITSVTLAEGTASGFNLYVKTLSTVKATVVAAGSYSSTISSIVVKVGNNSYTANSSGVATSGKLQTSGSVSVVTTVTDSRNRTATDTKTITVYDYWKPTANISIAINGTTVVTTVTGSIASVNNTNAKRLTVVRKKLSNNTTTTHTTNPLSAYSYTDTWTQTISDIDTESYEYTATVTDTKQSTVVVKQTAVVCISRLGGGNGVTFFQEASTSGFWVKNIDYTVNNNDFLNLVRPMSTEYSTTASYTIGDFVLYSDSYYECITNCSAGSWSTNSSKFSLIG